MPEKFLGIIRQGPSDFKSNRLHVDIFRFRFIHLRYMDSSKMIGKFPAVSNLNRLFLKLNCFIYEQPLVLSGHWVWT